MSALMGVDREVRLNMSALMSNLHPYSWVFHAPNVILVSMQVCSYKCSPLTGQVLMTWEVPTGLRNS